MADQIIHDLLQLQQYASGLQGLLAEMQQGAPGRSEGEDRTGSVRVILGPNGLPESFQIHQSWSRCIAAESFGSAVMEAAEEAISARMAAWAQELREQGWEDKAAQLRNGDRNLLGESPAAFREPVSDRQGRSISEITEDMIRVLDSAMAVEPDAFTASSNMGIGTSGRLSLTLSTSQLVLCNAEPSWVADQTAARLMNSLAEALASARANLAENASTSQPGSGLNSLLGEAFSMLKDVNIHLLRSVLVGVV